MVRIIGIAKYVIPLFGNKKGEPYGSLYVSCDGKAMKKRIRTARDGRLFFTANRNRYYVKNFGTLFSPMFAIVSSTEENKIYA